MLALPARPHVILRLELEMIAGTAGTEAGLRVHLQCKCHPLKGVLVGEATMLALPALPHVILRLELEMIAGTAGAEAGRIRGMRRITRTAASCTTLATMTNLRPQTQ